MFALDSLLPVEDVAAVEVTYWRGFRRDRAYVQRDGRHVGYRDLRTGRIHTFRCTDPAADAAVIERATADLAQSRGVRR